MTAISDIQQPALETPVTEAIHRSRARVVRRLFVAFLIGLALALMLAAAALVAWDLSYEGRVLPGVRVGATDLSGLDRAGATAALEQAYSGYGEGRVADQHDRRRRGGGLQHVRTSRRCRGARGCRSLDRP